MVSARSDRLVSLFLAVAAVTAPLWFPAPAEAALGLFRMHRTWWGGTPVSTISGGPGVPDPYISTDYHPRLRGPNQAPAAIAYIGSTTVWGRSAPRFTAPSKFIKDYTYYGACVPGTCFPGYPESKAWYSYWNLRGSFRPNNSRYGGASGPTTIRFPTLSPRTAPLGQGDPLTPTTTPCVGGGLTNCGAWPHSVLGHYIGESISFVDGNYDFSRAGSIMVTPGANRFGGTMHFFYGANHTYYQRRTNSSPYISNAYGVQLDVRVNGVDTVLGDVQYGGPFNVYQMTTFGYYRAVTSSGEFIAQRVAYFYTLAPFTTGRVTAWQPFGATNTRFTLTGYDNREYSGFSGVISLVRPRLVHAYRVPHDPSDPIRMTWASASAWQMDFRFLQRPEDIDLDGVADNADNCSERGNPGQDDTDGDGCGNLCDADYTQDGIIGFSDFGQFSIHFNMTGHTLQQHREPISEDRVVGFGDFGYFAQVFNIPGAIGPSGTTSGTPACP